MPTARTYGGILAVFRIAVGLFWIAHGVSKFTQPQDFLPPNGIIVSIVAHGLTVTHGSYHAFLANVVQPNLSLFAELVRAGEVVAGCLLLLGLFTRVGGLLGVVLAANYMLVKHQFLTITGWSGLDGVALVMSAQHVVLPTGRVLGFDWILGRLRGRKQVVVAQSAQVAEPIPAEFVEEPPIAGPTAPRD